MSLDQLMEIYWRWRKLECAFAVTLDSSTTTATVSDLERSHAGGSAFTTEASMVKPAPWKIEYSSATLNLEGFPVSPYPATWTTLSLRILDDSAVNVYYDGSDYYPHLEFQLDTYELGDEELGLYALIATYTSIDTGSLNQSIDLDLELSNDSLEDPLYTDSSGAITIKPTLYWAYKKLGGDR